MKRLKDGIDMYLYLFQDEIGVKKKLISLLQRNLENKIILL